jgi:iron(III) transport system ATP-binding protein
LRNDSPLYQKKHATIEIMNETTVICHNINKSLGGTPIVKNFSLTVESGTILALLGPSGCGKTTTLRLIAGFEKLDSGRIEVAGQVVDDGRRHVPPERRRVGMVFQDYAIFPHLSVAENVAFGLGRGTDIPARLAEMMALVGLPGLNDMMPHELSGGQQQRVALARALAPEPVILLLDEPFSNLDTSLRAQVRAEVRQLLKHSRATAIFVTHDQEEALFIGDRVAVMNEGQLEQVGTPQEVFHKPASRFVAAFMGQTDFIPGRVAAEGIETPLGLFPTDEAAEIGTAVEVAARPDDIKLLPVEPGNGAEGLEGNGRVVERRFLGIAYIYTVALADGTIVHSWQPHTVDFRLGESVSVSFRSHHSLVCFPA